MLFASLIKLFDIYLISFFVPIVYSGAIIIIFIFVIMILDQTEIYISENYTFIPLLLLIIQAFLFTNCIIIFVGIINYFLNSNYMFLCSPPNVNNPFLIGEWPYYLLVLECIFFIYGYVLLAPFLIIKYLNKNK